MTDKSTMTYLTKKLVNDDLKALVQAGVLNNDLGIARRDFVLSLFIEKNIKELAEMARAELAEKSDC